MRELEDIKQKIKQYPNFINSQEFANWRNGNTDLTVKQVSEILKCLPKDFNVDLTLLFTVDKDDIIEDSITHIQMKRNVGYNTAKEIFINKCDF